MDIITAMAAVFTDLINKRAMTPSQVPAVYQAAVKAKMAEENK
jgi:hypothetical protein